MTSSFKVRRIFLTLLLTCFLVGNACPQDLPQEGVVLSGSAGKISLDIKGMDIVDVLKMLATKADINLVIDKNVSGRVTVFLRDVVPEDALNVILKSNSLVAERQGSITRIMLAEDFEQLHGYKHSDLRVINRIKLKFANPQSILPVVEKLKSTIGSVIADDLSQSIILFDTEENNKKMEAIVHDMDAPLITRSFYVNYAKGDKLAEMFQDLTTKGVGSIKWEPRSSMLIVTDYPAKLEKIKDVITNLDERTKEISIDAKIVQVALTDKTSLGIDWEYVLNTKVSVKGMFNNLISTTGNKWTLGKTNPIAHNDYRVILEALRTLGNTRILSSPHLTVVNNEEANILVGSKQVYVTTAAIQSQSTTETAESVNFVDVGIKLHVTPTITHDGFISLKVKPEVSSVTQTYKTASGNVIPIVDTSEATTTVLIPNNSTIMIGGLIKNENIDNSDSIPFIGKIPILGYFFRNSVSSRNKTELAIFMTCKILDFNSPSESQ